MSAPSIRPETAADAASIRALLEAAFGRGEEADLVDRLRRDGDLVLSLVAETDTLVGHIAFCRLRIIPSTMASSRPPRRGEPGSSAAGHHGDRVERGTRPSEKDDAKAQKPERRSAAGASALAPLAVRPDRQGTGIGTALVHAGLARLRAAGEAFVLVVGEPDYYGRFGFSAQAAHGFKTPYDGPYLMALPLADARLASGTVRYPPAFAGL